MLLQAPPQTQPLAADDNEDNDYEGLETRAAVGEQIIEEETPPEEMAQEKRQPEEEPEGSEAEERAFKLKVAAVVRKTAKQKRFASKPHPRFRPAVGGGGAAAALDMQVHKYALQMGEWGPVHINLVE